MSRGDGLVTEIGAEALGGVVKVARAFIGLNEGG
jgi:hypothetical protein